MKTPILMAGLCLALAACATTYRLSSTEKLDLYCAHAGAPQNDMQFLAASMAGPSWATVRWRCGPVPAKPICWS